MKYIKIGEIIREFRIRNFLTQQQLCQGLCEPPTLSKIESGKLSPSKKLLDALVERLRIPLSLNVPITDEEFKRAQIEQELTLKVANDDFNIGNLLESYLSASPQLSHLEMQVYTFYKIIFNLQNKEHTEESVSEFVECLKITIPDYSITNSLSSYVLTPFELLIINNIAIQLHENLEKSQAISVLYQVEEYFDKKNLNIEDFARGYPSIAFNLSTWLGEEGRIDESLMIAEKGISVCIKYGRTKLFAHLLYNKGFSLLMLKNMDGIQSIFQALVLLQINESFSLIDAIRLDICNTFGELMWDKINHFSLVNFKI